MRKLLSLLLAVLLFFGCSKVPSEPQISTSVTTEATTITEATTVTTIATTEATTVITEPPLTYSRVKLLCAGDNLIHSSIYNQAKRRATANGEDGYDFSFVYEAVAEQIASADLAILNQETIITDEFEPSSYPTFCSPEDLGLYMLEIGFDVFSISNNHILDKGEKGLLATLDFWDKQENALVYGAYKDAEDMENIRILEKNGITFAFLGYMEHTNGLKLKEGATAEIVYLSELELIEKQVKAADALADVVVVSPHFGVETINEVTNHQHEITKKLVEWGADLIIGTQPHTAQSCEFLPKPDGGQAFVYYCLGNLVSSMSHKLAMVGLLGELEVVKNDLTGEITFENVKAVPIISHYGYNYSNVHIVRYADYTEEMAREHGNEGFSWELIGKILSYVPEEFLAVE